MERFLIRLMLAIVPIGLASTACFGWSGDGHRTIGMIADLILRKENPTAHERILKLLEGKTLSEVSVWADCAKGFSYCQRNPSPEETAFAQRNSDHHNYHYTDVPIQESKYILGTAGTRPIDIVQIIRHSVQVLRGQKPSSAANIEPKEAVWLLAHLVGDIHQPLHVGAIYFDYQCQSAVNPNTVGAGQPDFGIGDIVSEPIGGNEFHVNKRVSLHSYWDGGSVKGAMRLLNADNKDLEFFANTIIGRPPTNWKTDGDVLTWSEKWATEILPIAAKAIGDVQRTNPIRTFKRLRTRCHWDAVLSSEYTQWAKQQALIQLGKAGYRLANLLEHSF